VRPWSSLQPDPWVGIRAGSDPWYPGRALTAPLKAGTVQERPQSAQASAQGSGLPELGSLVAGYSGAAPGTPYREIEGSGGYLYRQYQDGSILVIRQGSRRVNVYLTPNSGGPWTAITREIGPYPAADPVSQIITAFQTGGRSRGLAVAAAASLEHGPGVVDAAKTYLQGRGDSAAGLRRRLAAKIRAYNSASGQRKQRLYYEIRILQARIAQLDGSPQQAAVADQPEQPGDTGKIPRWASILGISIGVASFLLAASR
jgi:hypothetical protein